MSSNTTIVGEVSHLNVNDPFSGVTVSVVNNKKNLDVVSQVGTTIISQASSSTPLLASGVFTSQWIERIQPELVYAFASDRNAEIRVELSTDAVNVDSTLTFYYKTTNIELPHRIILSRRYFRITVENVSGLNMTYMRLQTSVGQFGILSAPLNSVVAQDEDSILVRSTDSEVDISAGLYQGYSIVNKFGRNPDIDTGSVPEDIWNGGGVYTGFPTGAPEEFEVFSSDVGDTGVLTFTYLASNTSTAYQTATVTLNGTTPVATGVTGYRMHTARYDSGSTTGFNLGEITLRHRVTTANVFCVMPIGRSQTNVSAYTVPFGNTAIVKRIFCRVSGATAGVVEGALYIRTNGESPRLRRPFSAAQQDRFEEYPYGGLQIPANSDLVIRITKSSANNLEVIAGYDLVLIRDQQV